MKTISTNLPFFLLSLLGWLTLSQAYAQNTVYGTGAGTGGNYNTHIGYYAGRISSGGYNAFLGSFSGYSNTTGSYNTFLGPTSGSGNSTGSHNTFLGFSSGQYNSTGSHNTFLGRSSGSSNTSGGYNTFLGGNSGYKNSTGNGNTFVGHSSGRSNTTGSYNIFLGGNSGYGNTTGRFNTFVGINSGNSNTGGSSNTFLGTYSGLLNTTGANNTFLGYQAGYYNRSGSGNVFMGYNAGYRETGTNRLYIDNNDDSYPLIYGNFSTNVLSIGTKYTGTTYKLVVPGRVRATAYDVVSDERLKKDIHGLQDALAKVQKVEGVSYGFKDDTTAQNQSSQIAKAQADQQTHYGFLAQNIQQLFPELVTEDEGYLAVNYQGMIPVLVEAIKELSLQKDSVIQALFTENLQMKQELAAIKLALQQKGLLPAEGKNSFATGNLLKQNTPNPFDQSTIISYQVAAQAQQVSILITNLQGMEVQHFSGLPTGQGQVEVAAGTLATGTYVYTLVVDGHPVASRKMILTK